MKTIATSLKRSRAFTATVHAPNPAAGHHRPTLLLETPVKSVTVSCGVTAPFSWVLVHKVLLCPPRVYFPGLCKFWQLYGRVNGGVFLVVFKWWISAVKPLNPEFFFVEIFITDSVSLLVTGLFRFSISLRLSLGRFCISWNLSISSRLSNLLAFNCSQYSLQNIFLNRIGNVSISFFFFRPWDMRDPSFATRD